MREGQKEVFKMKRWEEIKETLFREGKVTVAELSQKYQVSEVSIRKDLTKLENEGFAIKFYGGAALAAPDADRDTASADFFQDPIRLALAKRAVQEINDGDCIFLGSGRTCCILARLLDGKKNLTVVTNNITAMQDLIGHVAKVYLIGGEVTTTDDKTLFSSWDLPQSFTESIFVNKAFTSISGLDLKAGLTVNSIISTYIFRHIPTMSHHWYVMMDLSKFDKIAIYPVAELKLVQTIIANAIPEKYQSYCQENGIEMVFAK
ncbi:MAG: DeoR/GlpR transcriptional regulator [Clostridia bacterium]|nr:DeoR/GlpR transcriptional regulator [Clostridia bacterium]NCC76279.1 DeoR/GlpR transcriptional regulator [Clostridia bacterium]